MRIRTIVTLSNLQKGTDYMNPTNNNEREAAAELAALFLTGAFGPGVLIIGTPAPSEEEEED